MVAVMNTTATLIAKAGRCPSLVEALAQRRASASKDRVTNTYTASSASVLFPTWWFELGIGDLRLPGISGPGSISRIRRSHPAARAILIAPLLRVGDSPSWTGSVWQDQPRPGSEVPIFCEHEAGANKSQRKPHVSNLDFT